MFSLTSLAVARALLALSLALDHDEKKTEEPTAYFEGKKTAAIAGARSGVFTYRKKTQTTFQSMAIRSALMFRTVSSNFRVVATVPSVLSAERRTIYTLIGLPKRIPSASRTLPFRFVPFRSALLTTSQQLRTMSLTNDELKRYGRQLILSEIGKEGQLKLKASSVLIVGCGGLGCPSSMYLAAAGVGEQHFEWIKKTLNLNLKTSPLSGHRKNRPSGSRSGRTEQLASTNAALRGASWRAQSRLDPREFKPVKLEHSV